MISLAFFSIEVMNFGVLFESVIDFTTFARRNSIRGRSVHMFHNRYLRVDAESASSSEPSTYV